MMAKHLEKLAHHLELGNRLKQVEPILGGALHNMWKLSTDKGDFAIKVINQHILQKDSFPLSYEVSEEIAARFNQHGIPAISAIKIHNRFVQQLENHAYLVYPYQNAKLCRFEDLAENQLQTIGSIFAKIHNLNLAIDGVDVGHYDYYPDEHWQNIIQQSAHLELSKMLPFLIHCNNRYKISINNLKANQVVTHRDMHSLNVLWDEQNQPYIIDWETAGLMDPTLEVVGYGIEWGGIIQGAFNKNNTQKLFQQYKKEIKRSMDEHQITQSFYGWIGHCVMGWTEFNIRRMLGLTSQDEQEHRIGSHIINSKMVKCIQYIEHNEEMLLNLALQELC